MTQPRPQTKSELANFVLDQSTPMDAEVQAKLEQIDLELRARHGMQPEHTAAGVLDFKTLRLGMVRPDLLMYGASVPKISILLAFFALNPGMAEQLPLQARRELGLIIKKSDDALASHYSRQLGLAAIQGVLNGLGFYDARRNGGIWMGKHYGDNSERIGDPIGNHSHAVTVIQLMRFYLLLQQEKLVSSAASLRMREIFASPEIPHDGIKFIKGLEGRDVQIMRKWGSWEDWLHDSAIVQGQAGHYILVGLTHYPKGDEYLEELAKCVDDWLAR